MRFIAATSVVFYHFMYGARLQGGRGDFAFEGLHVVTRFGYLGVTLFFMISGFVILWSSQQRSAGEFVVSRIARLFPSFWICVLLTTLVVNAAGSANPVSLRTLTLNLTMIPGALGAPYVDDVYWTLFVELKFYVLVYLVLLTGTMERVETWLGVWLTASIVCALGIAPRGLGSLAMYPYGPYFISGCMFFLIRARGVSAFRLVVLGVACVLGARYAVLQQPGFMRDTTLASGAVVASAVVAFHAVFLAIVLRPGILPASRWWYALGSLTYPLYLLHNQIGEAFWSKVPGLSPWVAIAIETMIVFALAWLIAAAVERRVCGAFHKKLLQVGIRAKLVRASVRA